MDGITVSESNTNPFDKIKQIDTDGNEYWLARDLMPILGYKQWRQFEDAMQRAIAACKNMGHEREKHFLRSFAKSTGGRPKEDFKLSRYGCYLTGMNGDSRKSEIAQAQTYFALKTREADFMPPGWDAEVWKKLPPQDKRHFRFMFRRRRFRPSNQGKDESATLPAVNTQQMKQKQIQELKQVIGEILPEKKERLEAAKQQALRQFWAKGGH